MPIIVRSMTFCLTWTLGRTYAHLRPVCSFDFWVYTLKSLSFLFSPDSCTRAKKMPGPKTGPMPPAGPPPGGDRAAAAADPPSSPACPPEEKPVVSSISYTSNCETEVLAAVAQATADSASSSAQLAPGPPEIPLVAAVARVVIVMAT
jgi:hypothetical protein